MGNNEKVSLSEVYTSIKERANSIVNDMVIKLRSLQKDNILDNSMIAEKVQDIVNIVGNINDLSNYEDNLNNLVDMYNFVINHASSFIDEIEEIKKKQQKSSAFISKINNENDEDYEVIYASDFDKQVR